MLETPILFLVFNRPEKTSQVFELIRAAKPKKLYVSADGARASVADEFDKCQETRKLITENVDWDCELFTLFRDENLGCKIAVSEGITSCPTCLFLVFAVNFCVNTAMMTE